MHEVLVLPEAITVLYYCLSNQEEEDQQQLSSSKQYIVLECEGLCLMWNLGDNKYMNFLVSYNLF